MGVGGEEGNLAIPDLAANNATLKCVGVEAGDRVVTFQIDEIDSSSHSNDAASRQGVDVFLPRIRGHVHPHILASGIGVDFHQRSTYESELAYVLIHIRDKQPKGRVMATE